MAAQESTLPTNEAPPSKQSDSSTSSVPTRWTEEVDPRWGDLVLLVCFLIAGLVDSAAFNMYGCFVSMQTGNFAPSAIRRALRFTR